MRILHISTRLILGGSQENTVLSCEGQARLGHEVHLAFGPIYGPEGSLLERVQKFNVDLERTDDLGGPAHRAGRTELGSSESARLGEPAHPKPITAHVVPHLVREVNPIADIRAYREIGALIRRINPDIVHTHSSKAGILGRAAAWRERLSGGQSIQPHAGSNVPCVHVPCAHVAIIHTIHGPPFMPIEGSLPQRAKIGFNNWLYTRAEKYAAKRCHMIVSVADAMTTQFVDRGIGRPEQYVTVRSGMEIEPFLTPRPGESREDMRAQLGLAPDDFVIGTVARLAQHKGHDDLLDALAQNLKNTASPRMKFLWIGDGWWRERLIAKARTLGLSVTELDKPNASAQSTIRNPQSAILLTGLVPPERVPAYIRAMDILAHPSYREGLPRTVPQALLSNVCPVAYDVDGTGEICRDMQTGCLVPLGDITKLRDAILWLRDHPAERAAMATRGREECRTAFSAETMVNQLEEVYATALKRAGIYEPRTK